MSQKKVIAVFDFDGTITTKETFQDFIIYTYGYFYFVKVFLLFIRFFIVYTLKIIDYDSFIRYSVRSYFKGLSYTQFVGQCRRYDEDRIDTIIRTELLKKIRWHYIRGHHLVIVTATLQTLVEKWATRNGFQDVITTIPEIHNNKFTGNMIGKYCNGDEKLRRFLEKYPDKEKYYLYVYGNSKGDAALLQFADKGCVISKGGTMHWIHK